MGKIISFINYKGGVGKTTSTYHIGCALALYHNKKVLLIDTDPQANLTFLCAIPEQWEVFKRVHGTIAKLFEFYLKDNLDHFTAGEIIWKSPVRQAAKEAVSNLDLIPSDIELLGIDIDLAAKTKMKNETGFYQEQFHIFRKMVRKIRYEFGMNTPRDIRDAYFYIQQRHVLKGIIDIIKEAYDYILIDCPPNLYLVTQNSLFASDYYLITTIPDHLSTIGISILVNKINDLNNAMVQQQRAVNTARRSVVLKGLLFTMVRKAGPSVIGSYNERMYSLQQEYDDLCFKNYISLGAGYNEAAARALPVFLLKDSNSVRVAEEYKEVTEEFLQKMNGD
ncbi:MAG: ParA family protein [Candidatus Loosdrechtia sp.]|uniref:ParA family protein n=1 Tax=Candidatus Loosdrechtia sp. TaxID=3101272 RepID=UPI003A6241B7|nr:MAG: AAA family ATPase [Candidatus Jettenia sp. AMX2]